MHTFTLAIGLTYDFIYTLQRAGLLVTSVNEGFDYQYIINCTVLTFMMHERGTGSDLYMYALYLFLFCELYRQQVIWQECVGPDGWIS